MSQHELRQHFPALTKELSDEDSAALFAVLRPETQAVGTCLTTYGEANGTLYLILSGLLSVHVDREGEDLILGQAGPGTLAGEVGLIEPGPSSATLQVLEEARTLSLSHERFETFATEHPRAASGLLRALSKELAHRLRRSSTDLVRRLDDHHWMRVKAREDHHGWLSRVAALVRGTKGARVMKLLERLQASELFGELDAGELEALAQAMELIEAEDGQVLIEEGDRADGCYYLLDGVIAVRHADNNLELHDIQAGEIFGLVALIDHGRRSASCTAKGPALVAWLPEAAFTLLHEGNPSLVLHFQKMVARQLARDARALNAALVRAMLTQLDKGPGSGKGTLSGDFHLQAEP